MSENNIIDVQRRVRENAEDVQKFLIDLKNWEEEMKKKEKALKEKTFEEKDLPPIRSSLSACKKRHKSKKVKEKETMALELQSNCKNENIEASVKNDGDKHSSDSNYSDEGEEGFASKNKQLAIMHKEKGNDDFKKGNFDSAICEYTTGMELDPENPLIPANRAMAFLKMSQYEAAEKDCTMCLSFDPIYVKAYLRRGTARMNLKFFTSAKEDFNKVLELEHGNKEALLQIKNIDKMLQDFKNEHSKTVTKSENAMQSQNLNLGNKNIKTSLPLSEITETSESKTSLAEISNRLHPGSVVISPVQKPLQKRSKKHLMDIKVTAINEHDKALEALSNDHSVKVDESEVCLVEATPQQQLFPEPTLPPVPSTSFQFLVDWKTINKYPKLMYLYLKQFPAEKIPTIFSLSMDAEIFAGILHILSTSFLENGDNVFPYLKNLPEVGRFNTLLIFLSKSEREDLEKLLTFIKGAGIDVMELSEVLQKYNKMEF